MQATSKQLPTAENRRAALELYATTLEHLKGLSYRVSPATADEGRWRDLAHQAQCHILAVIPHTVQGVHGKRSRKLVYVFPGCEASDRSASMLGFEKVRVMTPALEEILSEAAFADVERIFGTEVINAIAACSINGN